MTRERLNFLFQFNQGYNLNTLDFHLYPESSTKVSPKHIISIEDITINKELGMGQFGVVQQGTWATGNQRVSIQHVKFSLFV